MLQGPLTAHACGDKLAVIGGGVRFDRVSQSRYRGNVILLVEPESSLRTANDTLRLSQALETAGHRVRTVDSSTQLMQSLDEARADVVLVSWNGAGPLMAQLASRSPSPTVVPVAYKADPAVVAAASDKGDCYAVAERPGDKRLVRAVDRVMEQRRNDSSFQCGSLKVASAD